MDKEYEMKFVVSSKDDEFDLAQINDMFVEWAESNNLSVRGSIVELEATF